MVRLKNIANVFSSLALCFFFTLHSTVVWISYKGRDDGQRRITWESLFLQRIPWRKVFFGIAGAAPMTKVKNFFATPWCPCSVTKLAYIQKKYITTIIFRDGLIKNIRPKLLLVSKHFGALSCQSYCKSSLFVIITFYMFFFIFFCQWIFFYLFFFSNSTFLDEIGLPVNESQF